MLFFHFTMQKQDLQERYRQLPCKQKPLQPKLQGQETNLAYTSSRSRLRQPVQQARTQAGWRP